MSVVFIDGVPFKHSMSLLQAYDAVTKINQSRITAKKLRGKLKTGIAASPKKQQLACGQFLTSVEAALHSAVNANKRLDYQHRATLERCFKIASSLKVDCPIPEPVPVRPRLKKFGGFRVTHDFGLRNRTAQNLVVRVLELHFVPRDFQFTLRGLHKAIAETKLQLKQGRVHVATFDIKDHFGSFDFSKLAPELPLPTAWVEHVVIGRHLAVVADKRTGKLPLSLIPTDMLLHQARQGIPQGSLCSPIVAAICMSRLQWTPSAGTALLNYSDNFLILASTAKRLEEGIGKLTAAVTELPGGCFQLKMIQKGHASDGLDFLGHRLIRMKSHVRTTPSPANLEALFGEMRRLGKRLDDANAQGNNGKALKYLERMCTYLKGWVRAFSECDDISEWEIALLCMTQDNTNCLGVDVEHLYATVSGDFEYSAREYEFIS